MKKFEIRVTQDLKGFYEGYIVIEASNEKTALNKLKNLGKKNIDDQVYWEHGDYYEGDVDSIEIHEDSINELN